MSRAHDKTGEEKERVTPIEMRRLGRISDASGLRVCSTNFAQEKWLILTVL